MSSPDAPARRSRGEAGFEALGRGIAKHPWYPIVFWVILLLLAVPFLGRLGSVTQNSATTLPSSAPSAQAQQLIDQLFPNTTGGASDLVLVTGPNLTGPVGQTSVLAIAAAIRTDPSVTFLGSVSTVYSSYASYLQGNAEVALGALAAVNGTQTVVGAVNQSALLFWGPPAAFLADWQSLVVSHPGTNASVWNPVAFNQTASALASSSASILLLNTFYAGPAGGGPNAPSGFNGTADCAADPATVVSCTEAVARATEGAVLPQLFPDPTTQAVPRAVLANLATSNFTSAAAQAQVALDVVADGVGLGRAWVDLVAQTFPTGASPATVLAWTTTLATAPTPVASLPIPSAVENQYLDPTHTAELIYVQFTVSDTYDTPSGASPVFDSLNAIDRLVPTVLASTDPLHTLEVRQTGGAPLDQTEQSVLDASLAVVLPLTVLALVIITMLYFRAPLTPAVTFGGLGIALVLGLAGVVLIGTFITSVDSTALTLQNTFVLGVGTDYSIFLVARYREELWKGSDPRQAVITTVTWAGQSIATSGATAIIATLALAFSGVALLSQWGMVLSLAVLIAVLVSLTMVPAILILAGPRVFWPSTGERFRRQAAATTAARGAERTYFYRAARRVQRRPWTVVGLVLIASVPLFYVALTAPISYDFYGQLPAGHAATDGLAQLGAHFGEGRAFPSIVLVTFVAPLLANATTNATEFAALDSLTQVINGTPGVAEVDSPTGPNGAPLAQWLAYPSLPVGPRTLLNGTLSPYLGTDGRTVWITVTPSSPGLSSESVALLGTLRDTVHQFQSDHPEITRTAFGGGAAVTSDIQQQTSAATERMAIAVSIGLILVLLVVLRSWIIPILAVATIGLSIGWAWATTNLVLGDVFGLPMFYFAPTVLFILILGLGIDYNIFLLTRVREERLRGRSAEDAAVHGLASTGGIITAAAVILASAFAILVTGQFLLLKAIGFAVAAAVLLDAMVVRTYLVPAFLFLLKDRRHAPGRPEAPAAAGDGPTP